MIYSKIPLSVEQQADQLIGRGLIANRTELIERLTAVSYYRLSGYLYPFRQRDAAGNVTDQIKPGTTLTQVWNRYNFDRRLRIIILDAIERIEVAVRTRLVYHFVHSRDETGKTLGPFGHLDSKNFPGFKSTSAWEGALETLKSIFSLRGMPRSGHALWLSKLKNEKRRASKANNTFVVHFEKCYGETHSHLPLWMSCELMTCDTVLTFVTAIDRSLVTKVAGDFGFPKDQFISWTKAMFSLRNACAHHARVWNRSGGLTPGVPHNKNKNPNWYKAPRFQHNRMGHTLTACYSWLSKISSTTQWKARLFQLFDDYPDIPLHEMGLPQNWRQHPLWH